ncbi:MAG: CHRD domain-containing protein [Planctomycetota bacterium]|nr:CHRD domain-containing protein [Planctomycetota bacterium]
MTRPVSLAVCLAALLGTAAVSPAAILTYTAALNGPNEVPVNASPGTGTAQVDYDNVTHMMRVQVSFTGLLGTTTASHIHGPTAVAGAGTAGVVTTTPTFPGFPGGVTSGSYDNTLDLTLASSWNPSFITSNGGTPGTAETVLAAAMAAGQAYLNIHTTFAPGGEIRGFLTPVPEPVALLSLAVAALPILRKRRRRD